MKAKQCCEGRNKAITDLRRGELIGRKTAQVTAGLNRQSNRGKMPEWKAEQVYNQNMDIARRESKSAIESFGDLTPASREINSAMNAYKDSQLKQTARSFRDALGFSTARADNTRTKR